MADVRLLTPADSRLVPWKNGRGVTEEIAVGPDGASFERGDFDWRISKAAVPEAGPFSAFPGFDRVLVVTTGEGLALSHGDAARAANVPPLVPYRFSGDWPTSAELLRGAVSDFNVITRRGRATADVRVLRPLPGAVVRSPIDGRIALLHVLSGRASARVGDGPRLDVGAGSSVRVNACAGRGPIAFEWSGDSVTAILALIGTM